MDMPGRWVAAFADPSDGRSPRCPACEAEGCAGAQKGSPVRSAFAIVPALRHREVGFATTAKANPAGPTVLIRVGPHQQDRGRACRATRQRNRAKYPDLVGERLDRQWCSTRPPSTNSSRSTTGGAARSDFRRPPVPRGASDAAARAAGGGSRRSMQASHEPPRWRPGS